MYEVTINLIGLEASILSLRPEARSQGANIIIYHRPTFSIAV